MRDGNRRKSRALCFCHIHPYHYASTTLCVYDPHSRNVDVALNEACRRPYLRHRCFATAIHLKLEFMDFASQPVQPQARTYKL